ncbi:hypothetical protein ACIOD2_32255 [Amycolatopsis sp. NPDC088138]|uniref:hypothetical protein n=1 Tax=Amycolatopsis sp. NPDC088138 TaxID=3363938 RepID=UPI003814663F
MIEKTASVLYDVTGLRGAAWATVSDVVDEHALARALAEAGLLADPEQHTELERARAQRNEAMETAGQLRDEVHQHQVAAANLYGRVFVALGLSITTPWAGLADAAAKVRAERDEAVVAFHNLRSRVRELKSERDEAVALCANLQTALLGRLADLTDAAGKERSTEWLRTCATLPVEEWPPAPAYKGPMVPATERDERQARIEAALAECNREYPLGRVPIAELPSPAQICDRIRAALAGDQPPAEEPKRSEATQMVTDFHRAFSVAIAERPSVPLKLLRAALIGEEAQEASTSLVDGSSLEAIAKELADLVYVAHGTAVSLGIDLDEALRRVHASNMSKRNPDGTVSTRSDGKILKPATYRAPDLSGVALRDVEEAPKGPKHSHGRDCCWECFHGPDSHPKEPNDAACEYENCPPAQALIEEADDASEPTSEEDQ